MLIVHFVTCSNKCRFLWVYTLLLLQKQSIVNNKRKVKKPKNNLPFSKPWRNLRDRLIWTVVNTIRMTDTFSWVPSHKSHIQSTLFTHCFLVYQNHVLIVDFVTCSNKCRFLWVYTLLLLQKQSIVNNKRKVKKPKNNLPFSNLRDRLIWTVATTTTT